jgi:hypothetical protein
MQIGDIETDDIDIDLLLAAIAEADGPPLVELGLALIRMDDVEPKLLALLSLAADGGDLDDEQQNLLFYGLHLLGAARRHDAGAPLMRLLRLPTERLDDLLGDALTLTLSQIVTGVFDGDSATLMALIVNAEVDPFVRWALFSALAFLTWEGRVDAGDTRQLLERFYDEELADDLGICWDAWAEAIALLGWRDLAPRVQAAMNDGRIAPELMGFSDFLKDLKRAESEPDDPKRFTEAGAGYIEDIGTAFDWMPGPDEASDEEGWDEEPPPTLVTPAANPYRDVGRNDPCPSGSGKKFKKCCLAKEQA